MASVLLFLLVAVVGPALCEENKREPRHLRNKLCYKFGLCGGQGGFGFQGGNGGYQGYNQGHNPGHNQGYNQGHNPGHNQGYNQGHNPGHNQGYNQGYPVPPINIAISQSQTSSSAGGEGYGSGTFLNNYQYNNGLPNHGNNVNNHRYQGNGYNRPGYYGNGYGSYNNQFNGNYVGGPGGPGGYGFRKPVDHSDYYDEVPPIYEDNENYGRSNNKKD